MCISAGWHAASALPINIRNTAGHIPSNSHMDKAGAACSSSGTIEVDIVGTDDTDDDADSATPSAPYAGALA